MDGGSWHCTVDSDQDHPQELSEEDLQIAVKRREAKSKGEKERMPIWVQIPKKSKER